MFDSFEEAGRADAARDASLTPAQRIQIVLELRAQRHSQKELETFVRVCRVVDLKQG